MQKLWTIEWTDEFLTGFKEIDDMHESLASLVNELYEILIEIGNTNGEKIISLVNRIEHDLIATF